MRLAVIGSAVLVLSTSLIGCDFVFPCSTAVPRQLPDGSAPGAGTADDGFVAEATRWGEGRNAVLEVVESRSPSEAVPATPGLAVRGQPAHYQKLGDAPLLAPPGRPALVWQETSCRYTVFLDPSLTDPQVIDYAGRI